MTTAKPRGLGFFWQLTLHTSGILSGVFYLPAQGFLHTNSVLQLTQFLLSEEQREKKSSELCFSVCSGDLRKQGEQMGKVACAKASLNPASHSTEDLEGTLQLSVSQGYHITFLGLGFYFWWLFYHKHFNILSWKWEYLWDFWHWQHSVSPRNQ